MKRLAVLLAAILFAFTAQAAPKHKAKKCVSPSSAATYMQAAGAQRRVGVRNASESIPFTAGNVVILQADPEILIVPNQFDLKHSAVRFTPALPHRYVYSLVPFGFNAGASDTLPLKDDDSVQLDFKYFSFPFAGKLYDRCFVNSNGNITFDESDTEPPDLETLLDGPPRIAPFFADLDPETSGAILVQQTSDAVMITWLKVPEFFSHDQFGYGENTFQIVLYKDGRIDLVYDSDISATEALIGVVPGYGKAQLHLVDFTRGNLRAHPVAAIVENFHSYESLDIPSVMNSLYKKYSDKYDFVTLVSNFDLTPVPGAQAFAVNVQNDIKGIGNPGVHASFLFHDNTNYGSASKLQNITFLGNIHQYPSDPNRALPDTYTSTLQILAHEVAHRWLSYVRISLDGASSEELLGRDGSHWSFFFNSNGSFLEGNEILEKSSTSFATSQPFTGYSDLDLYLMGFISAAEVGQSFVVQGASNFSPSFEFLPESAPEPDVSFRGSARTVTIDDIVAANGARSPDVSASQKTFNHLFVLIVKKESPASNADIAYVEQLRKAWEGYFSAKTNGKGKIQTDVQ